MVVAPDEMPDVFVELDERTGVGPYETKDFNLDGNPESSVPTFGVLWDERARAHFGVPQRDGYFSEVDWAGAIHPDDRSRALLSADTATATGDDALLGLGGDEAYDQRDSVGTMMCLQSDLVDEGGLEALARSAVETSKAWGLHPHKIGYIETIPGQDRVVFEMIESELPGMRFYPFTEVWREGLPARRGQRWITTRESLHLAAAAAGAWGVAFPVKPGYDDVAHQNLIDQGSRWVMGKLGEAAPEIRGEAGFGSAIDGLVEAKKAVAERVYAR